MLTHHDIAQIDTAVNEQHTQVILHDSRVHRIQYFHGDDGGRPYAIVEATVPDDIPGSTITVFGEIEGQTYAEFVGFRVYLNSDLEG